MDQDHFTVGADIQEQGIAGNFPDTQKTGHDIPADIPGYTGYIVCRDSPDRIVSVFQKARFRYKWCESDRSGRDPRSDMLHDGIARNDHLLDFRRNHTDHVNDLLMKDGLQVLQTIRMVQRILDPADDIRSVGTLYIPAGITAQFPAALQIVDFDSDGSRTEIHCGSCPLPGCIFPRRNRL